MEKFSLQYLKSDNSGPWSDVSVCNRRATSRLENSLFKYDQILQRKDVTGLGFIVLSRLGFQKQFSYMYSIYFSFDTKQLRSCTGMRSQEGSLHNLEHFSSCVKCSLAN